MQPNELEELKRCWLDQIVSVRAGVPQLTRFRGRKGTVKSVNWNGNCLVEWDAGQDVGWYDIAPADLILASDASDDSTAESA